MLSQLFQDLTHKTTKNKVKKLTNKLLETREFPQCLGTIDDTRTESAELNEHCLDHINKKELFFPERPNCDQPKRLFSKRCNTMASKRS